MRQCCAVARAQDQTDGRVLAWQSPVLSGVVQVHMHLAGIGMREAADLHVDDHQAAQAPVEQQQVNAEPLVIDAQTALPADEREVATELQQEGLQALDQRRFKLALGVLVLEFEKFQDVGVLDGLLGRKTSCGLATDPLVSMDALLRDKATRS